MRTPFGNFYFANQVTPYVILFIERDGSTFLTTLLISHPQVHAVYERYAKLVKRGATAIEQLEWAREFWTPPLLSRTKAVGFKTKIVDVLEPDGFSELLVEKGCRIIQMTRRNHVKAVISKINARRLHQATGKWNLYDENQRMPPMAVDLSELDTLLVERRSEEARLTQYVNSLDLPSMRIEYEDLLSSRQEILASIFSFLEVDDFAVEAKTLKHTSDDLREVVLNFNEMDEHYRGTPYREMLHEGAVKATA